MKIQVVSGIGTGPTALAAFDTALYNAGIGDFNLIYLSSIVPPKAEIVEVEGPAKVEGKYGDRLYVVMAQERITSHNVEAWAGVGWVQDPETGQGLFVEHHGKNEEHVKRDIHDSLERLMKNRNVDYGEVHMKVVGTTCENEPVCALVAAVFETMPWNS